MCWPRQYFSYDDWPWDTIGQDQKVVYSSHPSRLINKKSLKPIKDFGVMVWKKLNFLYLILSKERWKKEKKKEKRLTTVYLGVLFLFFA